VFLLFFHRARAREFTIQRVQEGIGNGRMRGDGEKCAASEIRPGSWTGNFLRGNFNYFLGIHYSMLIDTCSVSSFLIFKVPRHEY